MKQIEYLDLHVAGEPFRLITQGFPDIQGTTMHEKKQYAEKHLDSLRKLVLLEPRGHDDMYGGFLTSSVSPEADFGVIFIHGSGMSTMCGHGAIALAKAAIGLNLLSFKNPRKTVIDTPAGTITLTLEWYRKKLESISLKNDLSFTLALDQTIITQHYGKIKVDVGYGGAFMVFADIQQFCIPLCSDSLSFLIDAAMECGQYATQQLKMVHPQDPRITAQKNGICMILFERQEERANYIKTKTFTVFGKSQFDRSPTGTGTSALAAILHSRGILTSQKQLINYGISGIPFTVTIQENAKGQVIPTIHSNAYLTGRGTLILEDTDPLQEGFSIKSENGTMI